MMRKSLQEILTVLVVLASLSGCATEYNLATGREETLLYGTEKEISIGDAVARQVDAEFTIVSDLDKNGRVQRILNRIVAVCDRQELVYTIKVIEDDKVNAFSLPGGYVYIFTGLMDKLKEDDQLAGVIAHEVGHITAKHGMKRLQNAYGYTLLQVLAAGTGSRDLAYGTNVILTSLFFAYSRQDEFESDELGVKYMKKAGYDPGKMIDVLTILKEQEAKAPPKEANYLRTHPYPNERMGIVNKAITGQIGFRDYLNLMGNE